MTPKIIQDTIISPLEELVNGNVEGWRKNWISTKGMVIYLSEQAKTRDSFHEALQPYYWMYLSDSFTGEDAAYPEFRSFIYTCIDSYQGLGEWFRTKDIDDVVESLARKRKEGRNLMDILMLLLRHGYRPYIKEWNKEKLEENIERLRVQGDRYHGEYYCILHAFYMIETADIADNEKDDFENLLCQNWDFLKHVYSIMIKRIVGCGHRNFRGVANNVEIQTSSHPYIHLFYNALIDRQEEILSSEREQQKMIPHIQKMENIMMDVEQEDTLDPLCRILFCEEFERVLARKRFKSYRELEDLANFWQQEAAKLEGHVKELEPLKIICESMKEAVENSIPVDDVVRTIVNFDDPKVSELVFNKLDWDLEDQPAWAKHRKEMKQLIKAKLKGPQEFQAAMQEYARQMAEATHKMQEKPTVQIDVKEGAHAQISEQGIINQYLELPNKQAI